MFLYYFYNINAVLNSFFLYIHVRNKSIFQQSIAPTYAGNLKGKELYILDNLKRIDCAFRLD